MIPNESYLFQFKKVARRKGKAENCLFLSKVGRATFECSSSKHHISATAEQIRAHLIGLELVCKVQGWVGAEIWQKIFYNYVFLKSKIRIVTEEKNDGKKPKKSKAESHISFNFS